MRYGRKGKRSTSHSDGSFWICFSDLMSALMLVFVLVMFYSIYQYFEMLEQKTAELLHQSGLLDQQQIQITLSQAEIKEKEQQLAAQSAQLAQQQAQLNSQGALLTEQKNQLDAQSTQLTQQQSALSAQEKELAALQTQLIDTACCMQQIQMRHLRHLQPDAVHHHARFKQRQIKRFSIKRNNCVESTKKAGDFLEHQPFFAVITHDILPDDHPSMINKANADFKCNRTCASAQPSRLRIQKQHASDIPVASAEKRIAFPDFFQRGTLNAA